MARKMVRKNQKIDRILEYIAVYSKNNGFPPSIREIQQTFNYKSTSTVAYYLRQLEERGDLVNKGRKNRTLTVSPYYIEDHPHLKAQVIDKSFELIPLVGTITAGQPILAEENYDETYFIPTNLFRNRGEKLFMLTVKGDSMIEAGIFNNDKIVVRRQHHAENGEIVVALIENSATVKYYYKEDGQIRLQPANSTMSPMFFNSVTVLGKVIGLIRNM